MVTYETFGQFRLFDGLDLEQGFLENLAAISEEMDVEAGEWLFREGDHADALYLLQSGNVVLKLITNPEKNVLRDMSKLGQGDSLGWSAIVRPYMYRLGAMATSDTHLIKLDGQKLRTLTKEDPEDGFVLMQGITQTMASRLQDVSRHVPDLTPRTLLSYVFMGLTIFTGILALIVAVGVIYSTATDEDTKAFPVLLFCLIVPAVFFVIARFLQTTRQV